MFASIRRKNRRTPAVHKPQSRFRPHLEALEDRCLPSGGVLDPTFAGGIFTTAVQSSSSANAVATYPDAGTANDGKID